MNSMQVKDKLKNISKEKNVPFNMALKFYIFDRFLVRLASSKYKDNFILKGGFILSSWFGIEKRSTMDIDSMITNVDFTEEKILKIIDDIMNINIDDNVYFYIEKVELIRNDDEYGGYRLHLIFNFDTIKEKLMLDIATGDKITPTAINYKHKVMLENNYVNLWSYNIETIIAEKLETIFSKVELSSRMKDYYDIYLIYSKQWQNIDKDNLKEAIKNTFNQRQFKSDLLETFKIINESTIISKRWEIYASRYDYAKEIKYEYIMNCLKEIVYLLEPVAVHI